MAFVACYSAGLLVVDVSDPSNMSIVGSLATGGAAIEIGLSNDVVYLWNQGVGIECISVVDPSHPQSLGTISKPGVSVAGGITFFEQGVIVTGGVPVMVTMQCLDVAEVSDPSSDTPICSAFPNPSSGPTRISLNAGLVNQPILFQIVNATGRSVRSLAPERAPSEFWWDARDEYGRPVPSGVYFGRISGAAGSHRVRIDIMR
jgi:hypothetical protein